MSMSSEVFSKWIIIAIKFYAIYFVVLFVGSGLAVVIYCLIDTWCERKGAEKEGGDENDSEGSS